MFSRQRPSAKPNHVLMYKKFTNKLGVPEGYVRQILLIMRLTTIILIMAIMQVSASTFAQRITLSEKNATLRKVFDRISDQCGYDFVINSDLLKETKPVTINVKDTELYQVLEQIFKDQPVSYEINSKTVIVKERRKSIFENLVDRFKSIDLNISGTVTDSLGRLLSGASVSLKGEKVFNANTDNLGRFKFNSVPSGSYRITISYIGYQKLERVIEVKDESKELHFTLSEATSVLDQVQVIAYGSSSRRLSVGSVTTIDAATIEKQPVSNVLLALQGQVPGLFVSPTGGAPGSAVKMQIRGQNTLASTPEAAYNKPFDQPLFIVDGVPFATQNNSLGNLFTLYVGGNGNTTVPGNGISPFNSINPADIESISILKDADATSIYGSQGANGVILITTKKGKPGKPSLNLSANSGINIPTRSLEMMNTKQYLAMRREALKNDKVVINPNSAASLRRHFDVMVLDTNRDVDWYDEFFNTMPAVTDLHASFSGGQQYSSFIVSAGATHTGYNFPGNFSDKRATLHSGYTYRSPNNKVNVQFGTDYSYSKNNASSQPKVTTAMTMPPLYPDLIDERDNLIWNYKGVVLANYPQYGNPYGLLRQPADIQVHNLNTSLRLGYEIIPGLNLSSNLGYSRTSSDRYSAQPLSGQDPTSIFTNITASFESTTFQTVNIEPQADYKLNIGSGQLSILAGGTYKKQMTGSSLLAGSGYPNDDLLKSVAGAGSISASNSSSLYKYSAGYARIGYIHDQKYILNLTGRRDGSSNFGPRRRFGNFGSVGAGWIFSAEGGFQKALPFISFGKLSANYGTNGSDGIAPYNYQAYYSLAFGLLPYQGHRPYNAANLLNPNYSWSTKKSLNAAIDLGFFKDRLLVNLTWYLNRMSDELLAYNLPAQTGFNNVLGNFPATMQNKGLELAISSTNIQTRNFKWTSNFNISGNRNKLVAFPGLETSPYATFYRLGESPSLVTGYKYKGVNETTGVFEYYTGKGEVTSNPSFTHITQGGDLQPLFNTDPKFSGGIGNTFTYKSLSLTLFFNFSKQIGANYLNGIYSFGIPGNIMNLPEKVIGRYWQKPGDKVVMQRLGAAFSDAYPAAAAFPSSSGSYSDASYVRLKTVSFSWALPESLLKKVAVKECRLFINAQNLLTFTNYELGDPEQPGNIYSIPLQRAIVGGLSFNF